MWRLWPPGRTAARDGCRCSAGRPIVGRSTRRRLALARGAGRRPAITVDYPEEGSIFPPEFIPPTFLWHDASPDAVAWRVDVEFSDGSLAMHLPVCGEPPQVGEIDPRCIAETNKLPVLSPQEASAQVWTPDAQTWESIKRHSAAGPATAIFTGLSAGALPRGVSRGQVAFQTSRDPVGTRSFIATCR